MASNLYALFVADFQTHIQLIVKSHSGFKILKYLFFMLTLERQSLKIDDKFFFFFFKYINSAADLYSVFEAATL